MSNTRTVVALAGAMSFAALSGAFAEDKTPEQMGADVFNKRCKTCHIVEDTATKSKKAGPNLIDVYGRTAGARELYTKFGKSIKAAGAAGLVWNTEELGAYLKDPRKYLRAKLDDKKAKSRMAYKLRKEKDRINVIAYLKSLNPPKEGGDAATTEDSTATN
ncbi:MAG: c-type cytochrome [Pseudomonadota bacterium]